MTYEFTDFNPSEQDKITHLRELGFFVYHLRNQEKGFTIEKRVWANRIGFLVTDTDILGKKDFITSEEFTSMLGEER